MRKRGAQEFRVELKPHEGIDGKPAQDQRVAALDAGVVAGGVEERAVVREIDRVVETQLMKRPAADGGHVLHHPQQALDRDLLVQLATHCPDKSIGGRLKWQQPPAREDPEVAIERPLQQEVIAPEADRSDPWLETPLVRVYLDVGSQARCISRRVESPSL